MTLTELRYIVAVAQERHFGRAAQRCFVSQPTLSIAIKKLEEELSVSLFDRSSNEVKPTETGERIITQAHRVLEEADRIKHLAASEQNELAGVFKLGLIFTVAPYLLPRLILSLRKLAPDMPLMLEEHYTANLTDSLEHLRAQEREQEAMLALWADEQRHQRARDVRAMEDRLADLAGEEEREEAAVRSRYEDVKPYVSSVALVLAVTEEDAEQWEGRP